MGPVPHEDPATQMWNFLGFTHTVQMNIQNVVWVHTYQQNPKVKE